MSVVTFFHRAGWVAMGLFCALSVRDTARADTSTPAANPLTIVKDGKAVARLYMPPRTVDATGKSQESAMALAVRELNYHLGKMSGATLEVVEASDASTVKAPAIVLGELAVKLGATPRKTVASKEGFRLLSKDGLVLIGGQSDEAALFGVYELLRKLGCDWVMPGTIGEVIPRRDTVQIAALDESQAPDFLFRDWNISGGSRANTAEDYARVKQWLRRQKGGSYAPPPVQTFGHYWGEFVRRHKEEFTKYPTMYALTRNAAGELVRRGPQIETTHPRVIALFVEDIKQVFERNHWPKDKEVGFPIGPADGFGFSISAESQMAGVNRINPVTGDTDQTDQIVLLGNTILDRLGTEYPNVWLGFYSYSWHGDYPARYKPHKRIVPIFAPISFSRFHSFLDENSKSQAYYKHVLEQWGALSKEQGNPLIYRGYSWNLADNFLPYIKTRIWGEELPFYKRMGVIGFRIEGFRLWSIQGPSDYALMRLAWDSSLDWRDLLHEFCRHSFGAGWQPMERYYLRLIARQHGAGLEAGSYHSFPLLYDDAFVAVAERDFEDAKKLAKLPEEKLRVDYAATSVESLKLFLAYHKARSSFNFAAAQKSFDAILEHQQRMSRMNPDLTGPFTKRYLERFLAEFTKEAARYSGEPYKIVERLPDAMPTMMDLTASGAQMRFPSPAIRDEGLIKTKTYSSTWDNQGLSVPRGGAVWYRHRFKLPQALKGQGIGLFLGGFDDEARVWVNGKSCGASGRRFSRPFVFDLTGSVRFDGENVLAIQIIHNDINELGVGGLFLPSFVFSGPRTEPVAKPLDNSRVLPGGEVAGE